MTAERLGWLLAVVCCIGLPLLSEEPELALAGGAVVEGEKKQPSAVVQC